MSIETVQTNFSVFMLTGFPSFAETQRLEDEMLAEAELSSLDRPSRSRHSPTTFHIAIEHGVPLGVASSTVGPLAELPLGLALAAEGVDLSLAVLGLPDPACELVSLSVDPTREESATGVTEALYRSFYRHAKESEARSAVVGVDPWIYDVLTEEYGVPFRVLGPPLFLLGRELLAIGGDLESLEAGIRANAPQFAAYLDLPYALDPPLI